MCSILIKSFFNFLNPTNFLPSVNHLPSKVLTVAGLIFLTIRSASAAKLQRKYDGGELVYQPHFSSLKPLKPEFGPFFPPQLRCITQKLPSMCDSQECFAYTLFQDLFSNSNYNCVTQNQSFNNYLKTIGQNISPEIAPYVKRVQSLSPVRSQAVSRFPKNLSAFLFTEMGLIENGNKACILKRRPSHYFECQKNANLLLRMLNNQLDPDYINQDIMSEAVYRSKGYELGLPNEEPLRTISIGINPVNHANYKRAMGLFEKEFLNDDCFFEKGTDEIIEFVKKVHVELLKGLPANDALNDNEILPGCYRKRDLLVTSDEKNLDAFLAKLNELKCSKKEIELFKHSLSKMDFQDPNVFGKISKQELTVWKKIAYIAPFPKDIKGLMEEFADKLKIFAQQELHPIALAAWAHCEIGRIHPFSDGNGRLARLFLNALLVKGGYEPVIFFDDETYTNAILEDHEKPGRFAAYLAQLIKEQSTGPQFLEKV